MMRSYSSAVRPSSRARSTVAFGLATVNRLPWRAGCARSPPQEAAVLDQAVEERLEQREPVGAARRALGRPLGMGHEAEHVAVLADHARDVVERAVRIGGPGGASLGV